MRVCRSGQTKLTFWWSKTSFGPNGTASRAVGSDKARGLGDTRRHLGAVSTQVRVLSPAFAKQMRAQNPEGFVARTFEKSEGSKSSRAFCYPHSQSKCGLKN